MLVGNNGDVGFRKRVLAEQGGPLQLQRASVPSHCAIGHLISRSCARCPPIPAQCDALR